MYRNYVYHCLKKMNCQESTIKLCIIFIIHMYVFMASPAVPVPSEMIVDTTTITTTTSIVTTAAITTTTTATTTTTTTTTTTEPSNTTERSTGNESGDEAVCCMQWY